MVSNFGLFWSPDRGNPVYLFVYLFIYLFIYFWLSTLRDWLKALKSCGDFLGYSLMKIVQHLYLTWNILIPRETKAVTISTATGVPFKVYMSWNHKVFVVTSCYLP